MEKLGAGTWYDQTGAVFLTRTGARLHPGNTVRDLANDARKAGITKRVYPHLLRHTAASHWLAAGRPVTEVSQLLGHSSPATTLRVYAHWIKTDCREAATALERAYSVGS